MLFKYYFHKKNNNKTIQIMDFGYISETKKKQKQMCVKL